MRTWKSETEQSGAYNCQIMRPSLASETVTTPSLSCMERRLVNRLTFLMKSIHNIHGHTLPPHVVKPARALRTRHTESYANLRARTDAYKFSFLPRSIRAWNSLPPEIIAIQNPDSYRNAIATALRKGTIEMTNITASSNNYKARTDIPIPLFLKKADYFLDGRTVCTQSQLYFYTGTLVITSKRR